MLKYAMIGGGEGAFIGDVHRRAIRFDGRASLVAGSFSRDEVNNKKTGESLSLDPKRVYSSYEELIRCEKELDFHSYRNSKLSALSDCQKMSGKQN